MSGFDLQNWTFWLVFGVIIVGLRSFCWVRKENAFFAWRESYLGRIEQKHFSNLEKSKHHLASGKAEAEWSSIWIVQKEKLSKGLEIFPAFVQTGLLLTMLLPVLFFLAWPVVLLLFGFYLPFLSIWQRKIKGASSFLEEEVDAKKSGYQSRGGFAKWVYAWRDTSLFTSIQKNALQAWQKEERSSVSQEKKRMAWNGVSEAFTGMSILLVLVFVGWGVQSGWLLSENLVALCSCLLLLYKPMRELSKANVHLREALDCKKQIDNSSSYTEYRVKAESWSWKNVQLAYGSKVVFGNLNLELPLDQAIWFKGANGSGKSTLLRSMVGNLYPQKGRIQVPSLQVNWVPQNPIFPYLEKSKWKELQAHEDFKMICEHILNGMKQIPLDDKEQEQEQEQERRFSGGETQRLCLLIALLENPDALLLDEPTSALPYEDREPLLEFIRQYCASKGILLVVSSHENLNSFELVDVEALH